MAAIKGFAPRKSWLLRSRHGMGKSQVVAQVAKELSKLVEGNFGFIDIRLGQYEVGDLIGLQRIAPTFKVVNHVFNKGKETTEEVTIKDVAVHDLPVWFPRDPDWKGLIFFDEMNRTTRDIQQWSFQAVLDYRTNFVDFSKGTMIVAAINDETDVYAVLGMEPAHLDRFGVIDFKPTIPEWLSHAKACKVHKAIITYVTKYPDSLDPPKEIKEGVRYPSRRSWFALSDEINGFAQIGDDPLADLDYLQLLSKAWVGSNEAIQFTEFVRKDFKVFSGKEIINKFPMIKEHFETLQVPEVKFYNTSVINYIKDESIKLNNTQRNNLFDYVKTIPKESASGFWSEFSKMDTLGATQWYKSDPAIATYILSLYDKQSATK